MSEQVFGTPDWGRINCTAVDEVDQLREQLAAATQRAEAAEADARVLRTLVRTASVHEAARTVIMSRENRHVAVVMTEYVDALFEAAGDNGAFANDDCGPAAVVRVAESLGATLDDLPEAQL